MKRLLIIVTALQFIAIQIVLAQDSSDPYDALYDIIMLRQLEDGTTIGANAVSPLIWSESQTLIKGESHSKFVQALDRFSTLQQTEIKAYGNVKRAVMQRLLWAVFDWTTGPTDALFSGKKIESNKLELQGKLVPLIKRLALPESAILTLPSTVAATSKSGAYPLNYDSNNPFDPFFPSRILDRKGPWVCLDEKYHILPPAEVHSIRVAWRSAFHVLIRLPEGRKQTLKYIESLANFRNQWVYEQPERKLWKPDYTSDDINIDPNTPQFPIGTQFALVQQALLISDEGKLIPSPIILTIQLRTYLHLKSTRDEKTQSFGEFTMLPQEYMRGNYAMKAIAPDGYRYTTILSNNFVDPPFAPRWLKKGSERSPRLQSCRTCHSQLGTYSFLSHTQLFAYPERLVPPRFKESNIKEIGKATVRQKKKDYTWGLLQGLWRSGTAEQGSGGNGQKSRTPGTRPRKSNRR